MFKLISDGKHTYFELNGKTINDITRIEFCHNANSIDEKQRVTLSLDVNITDCINKKIIEDVETDYIARRVESIEQHEREMRAKDANLNLRLAANAIKGE